MFTYYRYRRDAHDATLNYNAHLKFVTKWLDKLEAEDKKASETSSDPTPVPAPAAGGQAEAPTNAAPAVTASA